MHRLSLDFNEISEVSELFGMSSFSELSLAGNEIRDISPLRENIELGDMARLDLVILDGNPLSIASVTMDIPRLEERGIKVSWNPIETPAVDPEDGSEDNPVEGFIGLAVIIALVGIPTFFIRRKRNHSRLIKYSRQRLDQWEEEGYDVSEFRRKWIGQEPSQK